MPKSKPAFIEVKCPKCGKQFNSEEEMLKHYDEECTGLKQKGDLFSRKKVLAVSIIVILALSMFVFWGYTDRQTFESKTTDSDGDGIADWYEINVYHTDPNKIDTSELGLDDFNALFTYNIDPNNHTAVNEFLKQIPNVTANLWYIYTIQGIYPTNSFFSTERYVNFSMRDPLIKYLANTSEIKWENNGYPHTSGALYVDGSRLMWNIDNESFCPQPSYYFTHGRHGTCVPITMASMSILESMGYKAVRVGGKTSENATLGHDWAESLINGKVYIISNGGIYEREGFYEKNGWIIYNSSFYDPNWYLK